MSRKLWTALFALALSVSLVPPAAAAPTSPVIDNSDEEVIVDPYVKVAPQELPIVPTYLEDPVIEPEPEMPPWTAPAPAFTDGTLRTVGTGRFGTPIRGGLQLNAASGTTTAVEVRTGARAVAVGSSGAEALAFGVPAASTKGVKTAGSRTAAPAPVRIRIPDTALNGQFGADYASRVRWVLKTPGKPDTATGVRSARSVELAVPAGSYAVAASSTSSSAGTGDFAATQLTPGGSWQAGGSSGAFTWSYPLTAPPVSAGPAPSLALSYSSGAVDGRTGNTNNQTGWVGEGWDLQGTGFIERSYSSCSEDGQPTSGDLCYDGSNAAVTFAGHSGQLVRDDTTGVWRLEGDDNTRVELLTGAENGDENGEYWRLTTSDGTQYYFGRQRLPGWASAADDTKSVFTVPVAGDDAGEPCHAATFATSFCTQAYRWNLDHVVDINGNAQALYYQQEGNYYLQNGTTKKLYIRGGSLARVDYGMRNGTESDGTAPARVVLTVGNRCNPDATSCTPETSWPDTPFDLDCINDEPCTGKTSPAFYTKRRLGNVEAQIRLSSGSYQTVDEWNLAHTFPDPGDGTTPSLWLASIIRIARAPGTAVTYPPVSFSGVTMHNRVWATDGLKPLARFRIREIRTETGANIIPDYAPAQCTPTSLPASAQTNTMRCFPQWWSPDDQSPAKLDYFHTYPVSRVDAVPVTGEAESVITSYVYEGAPAWRYNTAPGVPDDKRTWSVFAGYGTVKEALGSGEVASAQQVTRTTYFRGLNGDRATPTGGTKSVSLSATDGSSVDDSLWWAGQTREVTRYVANNSTQKIDTTITTPWASPATATQGALTARHTGVAATRRATDVSGSTDRVTRVQTTFDADGLPVTVNDDGDLATGADDTCTRTTYLSNDTKNLIGLTSRSTSTTGPCSTTPDLPADHIADTRTFYDGATSLTTTPTRGLATRSDVVRTYSGTAPVWQTTTEATYDGLGRQITTTDPRTGADRTTSTTYTPATGLLTQVASTNPLGWTSREIRDPRRGQPTKTIDVNGRATEMDYDAAGRVTNYWDPENPSATASRPTAAFTYVLSRTEPSYIFTERVGPQSAGIQSWDIFDGLLRQRQHQEYGYETGTRTRLAADTFYDRAGRVESTTPMFDAGTGALGALLHRSTTTPRATEYYYDGGGRVVRELAIGDGNEKWRTSTAYLGDQVQVTPPAGGTPTATFTDARGNTTKIAEFLNSASPTGTSRNSTYTYSAAGQMRTMTDPAGNKWTWNYDTLGRVSSADDPDTGLTTTTYDTAGRIASTTDARAITVANTYDALDRQTGKFKDSTSGTRLASWTYDTATLGKGRVGSAISYYNTSDRFIRTVGAYSASGTELTTTYNIPTAIAGNLGGTYTYDKTLLKGGYLNSLSVPAVGALPAEVLQQGWEPLGRGAGYHSSVGNYLSGVDRLADGQMSQILQDQDQAILHTSWIRDATTNRITSKLAQRETTTYATISNESYAYNNAGLLTSSYNNVPQTGVDARCYRYDRIGQLTEAWARNTSTTCGDNPTTGTLGGPAPFWVQYEYDASGNRTDRRTFAAAGAPTTTEQQQYPASGPTATRPHAVTTVLRTTSGSTSTLSYRYDAAGNQIVRPGQSLTYDADGRLATITSGSDVQKRYYSADGDLLLTTGDLTRLYLPDTIATIQDGGTRIAASRSYTSEGLLVAERSATEGVSGSTVTFLDVDIFTGTTTSRTGTSVGMPVTRIFVDPYGNPRGGSGFPTIRNYLNQPKDGLAGLVHLGARDYDPVLGKFTTVDPILAPYVPRQNNGYTYSANNPVTNADPSGLIWTGPSCVDECGSAADRGVKQGVRIEKAWRSLERQVSSEYFMTDPMDTGRQAVLRSYAGCIANRDPSCYAEAAAQAPTVEAFNSPEVTIIAAIAEAGTGVLAEAAEFTPVPDMVRCFGGNGGSCAWAAAGMLPGGKLVSKGLGAVRAIDKAGDHIVLGLREGLEDTAAQFGGRTLLNDSEWMASVQRGAADPSTRFTVSLDGMSGGSVQSQVMSAAQRGASGVGTATDWEMSVLYQAGRLGDTTFVSGGQILVNPFG